MKRQRERGGGVGAEGEWVYIDINAVTFCPLSRVQGSAGSDALLYRPTWPKTTCLVFTDRATAGSRDFRGFRAITKGRKRPVLLYPLQLTRSSLSVCYVRNTKMLRAVGVNGAPSKEKSSDYYVCAVYY